jgi:hypothetical protein
MAFFLFLILVAVALGIVGEVIHGLFFLLIVGIVVFLGAFVLLGFITRRHRRPPVR